MHSNQVGLPGGKKDLIDASLEVTVNRECQEEIGISPEKILIEFPSVYIPPSNFMVHPFVGVYLTNPVFKLDAREVKEHIVISVKECLEMNVCYKKVTIKNNEVLVPCYTYHGHVIWGATAFILSVFRNVLS